MQSPFGDEPITEVPLPGAPLARVLAQVRFPRLSSMVGDNDLALQFAAAVRDDYPLFEEQRETTVVVTSEGVRSAPDDGRVWRLRSADEAWQVSFGETFMAVDTASYQSRDDFVARLASAVENFVEVVAPPFMERLGVRYINRIDDAPTLARLSQLVRPEVLGGVAVPLPGVALIHSMSESLYVLDASHRLQARWGLLPPGAVLDASTPPLPDPSWVLDVDSYREMRFGVDSTTVADAARTLADRAYRFFRWAVTGDFLSRYGGTV